MIAFPLIAAANDPGFAATMAVLGPAFVLLAGACVLFLGATFPVPSRLWGTTATAILLAASLLALGLSPAAPDQGSAFLAVRFDTLAALTQGLGLIVGVAFTVLALHDQESSPTAGEFYALLLTAVAGLCVVAVANDLLVLFLGLELISVPTYVLLYLAREGPSRRESTVKYFLLSVLSAAVLLYGFSLVYGLTGSTNLGAVQRVAAESLDPTAQASPLGILAMVLVLAGMGFKIAAVPFHFYAPDVYQGTNAWSAGLLSIAPKIAGFVGLIRVTAYAMPGFEFTGQQLCVMLAMATMVGGNVLALLQSNVRRLLAYSSIAHAGYMLVGLAVAFWFQGHPDTAAGLGGFPGGVQATLFYLVGYTIASVGVFGALVYLGQSGRQVEHVEDLTGLWRSHPVVAVCLAVFMFSLAGIPPLPGFWGKLTLFGGALGARLDSAAAFPVPAANFLVLAVTGMVSAAIAAVYYLRIVSVMFLHEPLGTLPTPRARPALATVVLACVLTVLIGLQARPVLTRLQDVAPPAAAL